MPVSRVVVSDMSGRKRSEEEKHQLELQLQRSQNMETLGRLAGGVAHDMNNVLAAILGLASTHLEIQPEDSSAHRAFDIISQAACGEETRCRASWPLPTGARWRDGKNPIEQGHSRRGPPSGTDHPVQGPPGDGPGSRPAVHPGRCQRPGPCLDEPVHQRRGCHPGEWHPPPAQPEHGRPLGRGHRQGYGTRDGQGGSREGLGPLLHHQGCGKGHRAGSVHGLQDH